MLGGICIFALLALATATPIPPPDESPFPRHVNVIPAATARDADDFRLPTSVIPLRYNIKLVPFITEGNFTFKGEVLMSIQALEATDSIVLHVNKIEIEVASIVVRDLITNEDIPVTSAVWDEPTHFYTITLGKELTVNGQYTVRIGSYTGILDNDNAGFYRSSYVENGVRRWLATTQFESTAARRAFPCFDEPALKARITLSISRPENLRAISNMPQVGEPELDTVNTDVERYWDNFQETPPMSTYLLAFIVSDFVFLENAAEHLRIFSQPSLISQARYSLSVSPPILNWLSDYTGVPFHLPKMDEAALTDFAAGAMENWGLVTYRERLLLVEEGVTTTATRQSIATVIAHEYAHQWFGDLVSPLWWKYTWLNEGFATYFESFATHEVEPTWRLAEQFVINDVQAALASDATQTSHPMTVDVTSPASISAIFDTISYSKAGSVIRMMEHIVSPATFKRGLNRYLLARSYQPAEADDLFNAINDQLHEDNADAADVDIKKIMDTWSLQMGYPLLNVSRNYDDNTAVLTQSRFLMTEIPDYPDTHDYKWHIPLTYTTQNTPDFENTSPKDWFDAEDDTKTISSLPDETEWVLFNVAQSSYYRVNYDAANWALLTAHLNSDNYEDIHLLNRAQLIDDSYNLARAGVISHTVPLELSRYLARELDYIPWSSAFVALTYIDRKLINIADYATFQTYLGDLTNTLYTTTGYDEGANDDHVLKLNRAAAVKWACYARHADCISKSVAIVEAWSAAPETNPITPDLKGTTYCTAVRFGGQTEWDFMFAQYVRAQIPSDNALIVTALGCTRDIAILNSYMALAVDTTSSIKREDSTAVFTAVYTNAEGVDAALEFVIAEYQKISDYNDGIASVGTLLVNIASRCNSQTQADKMSAFLAANTAVLGDTAASVERAIEIVRENIEWQATTGTAIIDWIKNIPNK